MQCYRMPLAIVLAVGIAATAYAQQTQPVVKLPDQIEWKAPPMVGGASTAVLFGDPTKAGVYVTRTKFPAGWKRACSLASLSRTLRSSTSHSALRHRCAAARPGCLGHEYRGTHHGSGA